ncbi:MAG: hypothetical protein WC709_08005 [Thermoleophilia bacterium]
MSTPQSPAPRFTTRVRVRDAEADSAGVVHGGICLTCFEVGRGSHRFARLAVAEEGAA